MSRMVEPRVPLLEMLWEATGPLHALNGRFGLSDAGSARRWVVAMLHDHWGVRIETCQRIVMSDHNALAWVSAPNGRLVAKWSVVPDRFPRLSALARLTQWLDGQGLPVSPPVPALDGRPQVEVDGVSMCLQREIEGDLLDTGIPTKFSRPGRPWLDCTAPSRRARSPTGFPLWPPRLDRWRPGSPTGSAPVPSTYR